MYDTLVLYRPSLMGFGGTYLIDKFHIPSERKTIRQLELPWNLKANYLAMFKYIYVCDYIPPQHVVDELYAVNPEVKMFIFYQSTLHTCPLKTESRPIYIYLADYAPLTQIVQAHVVHECKYSKKEEKIFNMLANYSKRSYQWHEDTPYVAMLLSSAPSYEEFASLIENSSTIELTDRGRILFDLIQNEYTKNKNHMKPVIFNNKKGYAINTMFMPNEIANCLAEHAKLYDNTAFGMAYYYGKDNTTAYVYLSTALPHTHNIEALAEPYHGYGNEHEAVCIIDNFVPTIDTTTRERVKI